MVLPLWRKVFLSFSRLLVTADLPRLARGSCRAAMLLLSRKVNLIVEENGGGGLAGGDCTSNG